MFLYVYCVCARVCVCVSMSICVPVCVLHECQFLKKPKEECVRFHRNVVTSSYKLRDVGAVNQT